MYYSELAQKFISIDLGSKQVYTFKRKNGKFLVDSRGVLIMVNGSLADEIQKKFNINVVDFGVEIEDKIVTFPVTSFF